MGLYQKHRPKTLGDVVGQRNAVTMLQGALFAGKLPRAILFSGPPGVGKTTLARILARAVGSSDYDTLDLNMADFRGIDDIRSLIQRTSYRPMSGGNMAVIMDEFHQVTGTAAKACLKMLEDIPDHLYYFVCTSEPQKVDKALKTRLTPVQLAPLSIPVLQDLVQSVALKEDQTLTPAASLAIAQASQGSARQALVHLEHYLLSGLNISVVTTEEQETDEKRNVANELMFSKNWAAIYVGITGTPDDELETLRWVILNYAAACMKNNKNCPQATKLIICFGTPFFDSKKAGFLAAAWRAVN